MTDPQHGRMRFSLTVEETDGGRPECTDKLCGNAVGVLKR